QSREFAAESENLVIPGNLLAGGTCQSCPRRPGASNGNGRSRTPFTTLKIAVLAPIPRARTITANAANPGALRTARSPYLRSVSKEPIRFFNSVVFSNPQQIACRVPALVL